MLTCSLPLPTTYHLSEDGSYFFFYYACIGTDGLAAYRIFLAKAGRDRLCVPDYLVTAGGFGVVANGFARVATIT